MNKIETLVYHVVRKNPLVKQIIRNLYQGCFDLFPRKNDFFYKTYSYCEDYFFGFHDVTPFSKDDTKVLANHLLFDMRMPSPGDSIEIGFFNLVDGTLGNFSKIATSSAWNYHKGCRLQWLDEKRVIFNSFFENKLVSKIIDVNNRNEKLISYPIDSVFCDKTKCIATSFSYERLERCMPGYGYPYKDYGYIDEEAPCNTGLYLIDLNNNTRRLLLGLDQIAKEAGDGDVKGYLHFVTHTSFSKDGRYVSFLYRRIPMKGDYMKRRTKILVYDLVSCNLITLPSEESGSHYVWNDKNQIIASCILRGKSCHVLFDLNDLGQVKVVASEKLNSDGHQAFITNNIFVTDTYPDKYRMSKIYNVELNGSVKELVSIYSPKEFQTKDFKRHIACDLHPRVSPSGKYMSFDSARTGKRSFYVMKLQ